jgi:hypothetical protein
LSELAASHGSHCQTPRRVVDSVIPDQHACSADRDRGPLLGIGRDCHSFRRNIRLSGLAGSASNNWQSPPRSVPMANADRTASHAVLRLAVFWFVRGSSGFSLERQRAHVQTAGRGQKVCPFVTVHGESFQRGLLSRARLHRSNAVCAPVPYCGPLGRRIRGSLKGTGPRSTTGLSSTRQHFEPPRLRVKLTEWFGPMRTRSRMRIDSFPDQRSSLSPSPAPAGREICRRPSAGSLDCHQIHLVVQFARKDILSRPSAGFPSNAFRTKGPADPPAKSLRPFLTTKLTKSTKVGRR